MVASTGALPLFDIPDRTPARRLGMLLVERAAKKTALPLAEVKVSARVADRVAEVVVSQRFQNPHAEPLEAVYIFPLPGGAAVRSFTLSVGARTIVGKIEERGEARRQYQEALESGKRAALLEKERDDVFTMQVGNLPPGEEVTVRLTYSERLPFFEDGATELRLPLVVAPRYIPGDPLHAAPVGDGIEHDTDLVGDASRISPPRLAPGFDPKVSLGIEVEILGGAANGPGSVADLSCSQHATRSTSGSTGVRVSLAREDEPLDRDFVLRWRLAGDAVQPSLVGARDESGALYAMLSIVPPRREGFLGSPRDVVFVVDRSGSMDGVKMVSAARACSSLLATLGPRDRFAIQAFDTTTEWLDTGTKESFIPADEAGIERGRKYLREIGARGGTELDGALKEALERIASRGKSASIPIIVLLTDGQIGDESRVLARIQKGLGDARVFTIGVDTAVNEGFLKRLATLGGGTATFVEPGAAVDDALRAIAREIGAPLVVDLEVKDAGAGLEPSSLAPQRIPDLFAGRAATVFLKVARPGRVAVTGRTPDGEKFSREVELVEVPLPAIASLWARERIAELEDRFRVETHAQEALRAEMVALAVRHSILTRFTAFVVVDESEAVAKGEERRKIVQPVATPALWDMQAAGGAPMRPPMVMMPSPLSAPAGLAPRAHGRRPTLLGSAPTGELSTKTGGLGRLAKRIARVFESEAGDVAAMPGQEASADVVREEPLEARPTREDGVLSGAIAALATAMESVRAALDAGRSPAADELEAARVAILSALAASHSADALPLLQRFVRGELADLVAALKAGASVALVRPIFDRSAESFAKARAEAGSILGGSSGGGRAFWEGSV